MRAIQYSAQLVVRCETAPFLPQILFMLLYRGSLDYIYVQLVSPLFAYSGFTCDPNWLTLLTSYALVAIYSPFAVELQTRPLPSAKLVALLHYIYFIPLTSYCSFASPKVSLLPIAALYWALLLFWELRLPVLHFKPLAIKHTKLVFVFLSVFSTVVVLYISGRYTGFRLTLNFFDVYGIRAEAAGYSIPSILFYLLNGQTIMLSVEILYWLKEKCWLPVIGLIIVYFFYFSIAAHKSTFFFLFLVLAVALLYRKWMMRWCAPLLVIVNFLALLENKLLNTFYIMSFFIRRMMYVPADLAATYQEYFSENPILYFRSGLLRRLGFENPYSLNPVNLIGEHIGSVTTNCNTGLLGDLFANLPMVPGVILMPLLLAGCFRLMDMAASSKRESLYLPFCLFFAVSFANSSWSTVLLTHGFLLSCIFLYFFPQKEGESL